jgi:hypothetical protein
MSKATDWLPYSRNEILIMSKNWLAILKTAAGSGTNADKWNVPANVVTELAGLEGEADTALAAAKNEETRTPVANARCKTAFDALVAKMRDIKKRWFYVPPLSPADLVALGLKPRDTIPTASGTPTAQVTIETFLVGRHQLGVKINYVTGNSSDTANKGYRIWYSVAAQGETAPVNPDELRKSVYTKRKKDIIDFEFGDSGKTAYFAVQVENDSKKGPWGPLVSALIP